MATPRQIRRRGRLALVTAVFVGALFVTAVAFGAVTTSQPDYSPGSVVTIMGGNANGAGYVPGNTVDVTATADNGLWADSCTATVADDGSWSCTVTLSSDESVAVGSYTYTAISIDVNGNPIIETGTFTDVAPPKVKFQTTGLPSGTSVSVSYGGTNNGGHPYPAGSAISFSAPGPSGDVVFDADTNYTCGFPASISTGGNTYDLTTDPCASSHTTGANGTTVTLIGGYTLHASTPAAPTVTKDTIGTPKYTLGGNTYVTSATLLGFTVTGSSLSLCTIGIDGPGSNDASFSCTASDNTYTLGGKLTDPPDGSYDNSASATNGGGTASDSFTVILDNTAPTTTDNADSDWHNSQQTITLTPDDGTGSGVASTSYKVDTAASYSTGTSVVIGAPSDHTNDGTHTIYYHSTDNVGNVESPDNSATVKIDTQAPSVSCDVASFLLNQPDAHVSATVTDQEGLSGPLNGTEYGDANTSSVGTKSVSITGYDNAGNSKTVSCQYTVSYGFDGLYAPVDKPNTLNVSRAGQAIPLKWRLTDYYGDPVLDLSSVTVTVTGITCSLGTSTDQVEEFASGSSGLQNLGDGYYQYNWKTPTSYAGSCKNLNLKLGAEATRHNLAYFSFKK